MSEEHSCCDKEVNVEDSSYDGDRKIHGNDEQDHNDVRSEGDENYTRYFLKEENEQLKG